MESCFLEGLLVHVVSNTDLSLCNEIHLEYLFFFVVDHIFVFFFTKVPGFQPKSNIIQEFALFVFLGIEEEAEVVEDIIE